MDLEALLEPGLRRWLPLLAVLAGSGLALAAGHYALIVRSRERSGDARVGRQALMALATVAALLLVVLALPISEGTRGQLLGLLGVVLTGVIAFSSTTFVANAMAGLMLRAVGNFKPGDFVQIQEHFGRVSERGLFHTEIQTEDRDLTTLPNLFLVTHAVTVVRASGTIVSATVSLGYDVSHEAVESLLHQAATRTGLADPFVHVVDLGDFSVTYRAAGFLTDVNQILTTRSQLRVFMMDALHDADIEIVSPTFMNQRQLEPTERVVAPPHTHPQRGAEAPPETRIFDKAELAGQVETLRAAQTELTRQIADLEREAASTKDDAARARLEAELARRRARVEAVEATLLAQAEAAKS